MLIGSTGNLLMGAVGPLFSLSLLQRLHRRFRTWKAPALAAGAFAVMFPVSAFVIGPALSGGSSPGESHDPAGGDHRDHGAHHSG